MTARHLLWERVFGIHVRAAERAERKREAELAARYEQSKRLLPQE